MRKLIIDRTSNLPKVILDPENKIYEISGESRHPDVADFYDEIIQWLSDFSSYLLKSNESKDPVIFNFYFEYFNSLSATYILELFRQLAKLRLQGNNMKVKWHYERGDVDMMDIGREMSRMAKLPFEYVQTELN